MPAPRAVWKGFLKFGAVTCAVKLVNATSDSSRVHFRILNRKDRLPVKSIYIDESSGKPVAPEDQVKGFEIETGEHLLIEQEEIAGLKAASEHTLEVGRFVELDAIDSRYLDKPYFVIPGDPAAREAFGVVRAALADRKVAATSQVVLYQRGRNVVLRSHGAGMLMTTLRTHAEMVSEKGAFDGLKSRKLDPDLIEVASLLIDKKTGTFDPKTFEDRYENALIELIAAKRAGKKPPKPVAAPKENVVNLADVLRRSLAEEGGRKQPAKRRKAA